MNYKQFLNIYNQGPEEVYSLLKTYKKRIESLYEIRLDNEDENI